MSVHAWRRRVASTPAATLVFQPAFWLRQRTFGLVLAVAFMLVVVLAPYTYGSGKQWEWLSIAVQSLAVWGIAVAARAIATLTVETALAAEIEAKASSYLADVKGNRRRQADLDRLEEELVPNNPAKPVPAMIRLFQNICKEARDRRFDSGINLMQPLREEALEALFRLQNLQKIALWLGILGTFVGMLVALQSGGIGQIEGGDALLRIVQRMFDGLFIAFTASVAGLEVAVTLGFLLLLVRRHQEQYFAQMESAVVTMLSAARHAINQDDFFNEFAQVTSAVSDLTTRVYQQTQHLGERLDSLNQGIGMQSMTIHSGLEKLAAAGVQFDGFLKSLGDSQRKFITDLQTVHEALRLDTFGPALEAGVKQAGDDVSKRLTAATEQTASQLTALNASIQTLKEVGQAQSRNFAGAAKELTTALTAALGEHSRAFQTAQRQLQNETARQGSGTQAVVDALRALTDRIGRLDSVLGSFGPIGPPRKSVWETVKSLFVS